MSFSDVIINGQQPDIEGFLQQGNDLNDIDEYGFTPLIECAIAENIPFAKQLIANNVDINKPDVSGRTALHWAIDNNNVELATLLLKHGANPNAYNRGGQPTLVFPLLRHQFELKQLLYRHGANLNFAQDFINTKLIGHRFQLKGDVDIVTDQGEFIELDYEGFFLEFTLAVIHDSLRRFRNHYSARQLREYFFGLDLIIEAFEIAQALMKYQSNAFDVAQFQSKIDRMLRKPLLILPVAYRGHAITFIKCGPMLAKCDRGENSQREGTVNIYYVNQPEALSLDLLRDLIYKKQSKRFVHHHLNDILGLQTIAQLPLSAQISGNCSWANVDATVPTAYLLVLLQQNLNINETILHSHIDSVMYLYEQWIEWDKDRALYDCLQSFDMANQPARKASKVSILSAILFQACQYGIERDFVRADKIIKILTLPQYKYILQSYLDHYVVRRLTKRGNNLLNLLEDSGVNAGVSVHPIPIVKRHDKL